MKGCQTGQLSPTRQAGACRRQVEWSMRLSEGLGRRQVGAKISVRASLEDLKQEFDESLGYIRQDIRWLIDHDSGLNYTIALLIGCGCEMLAALDDKNRRGEKVFAELLPAGEWQLLAARIYGALRDGLAHGFDTKHLLVDGSEHQIYISVRGPQNIRIKKTHRGLGLYIGIRRLAEGLCNKITNFEARLAHDEGARQRFIEARQPTATLSRAEAAAWHTLIKAAGF
jgi:hypothetical protein